MAIYPYRAEERTTRRRGALSSVIRVHPGSVVVSNLVSILGWLAGAAVMVGVFATLPMDAGRIRWVELFWVEVFVFLFMAFLYTAIYFHVACGFPRRVTLGRDKLLLQTRDDFSLIPLADCRWWRGSLADDMDLMGSGARAVSAIVIEYFDEREKLHRVAIGTALGAAEHWERALARRAVPGQAPTQGRLRSLRWSLCGLAGGMTAGVFLAIAHAPLCRVGFCTPREGDIAGYIVFLGLVGTLVGLASSYGDAFRFKKRSENLAFAGLAAAKVGAMLWPFGGPVIFLLGVSLIFGFWTLGFAIARRLTPEIPARRIRPTRSESAPVCQPTGDLRARCGKPAGQRSFCGCRCP